MDAPEITSRLKVAAAAVADVDLPDAFKAIAFQRALDAVGLSASPAAPAPAPASRRGSNHPSSDPVEATQGDTILKTIATRLNLPLETVEQVYEDDPDNGLRLIVKRTMLPQPDQKAASMRHITLLLAVGRQVGGVEDYTAFSLVRDECAEVKVLDTSNFATEIGKLQMRRRGPRNKQEVKVNRHHLDEAADLIRAMYEKATS